MTPSESAGTGPARPPSLSERSFDFLELHAAGFQQHQQMKHDVGAFGDQVIAIVADPGDHGFDRFLAEFLGAVLCALVEQLFGVRRLPA